MSIRKLNGNSEANKEPGGHDDEVDNYTAQNLESVFSPAELQMMELENFIANAKLPQRDNN